MVLPKRLASALLCIPLLLAACGEGGDSSNGSSGAGTAAAEDAESISFGELLAEIRGHHKVGFELYEAGNLPGAVTHASHPIDEIMASVQTKLEEADSDVASELEASLDEVRTQIQDGAEPGEVAAAMEEAVGLTEQALADVVGPDSQGSAYQGSVIAALLDTASHEYEEAIAGGDGVKLVAEYQDGYAFVREAEELYEGVAAEVEEAAAEEAEEIEEAFAALKEALPAPQPPEDPAPLLDVSAPAELIGHELEETLGATLLASADPEEVEEEINRLLDEIVAAYEAGDADAAAELAAEAYLENYEVIEAGVIEQAPEINEELEPLLGAELRAEIQDGASAEEIEQMVERARTLLEDAVEALESHE